jgi:carbamoyl-phosphate synthase small subunit
MSRPAVSISTRSSRGAAWPGLVGMDLVPLVTTGQRFTWDETPWRWGEGYGRRAHADFHVVAIDYGIKRNILRQLAGNACSVTVVPAQTSAADILALKPDGIFLSNGPGDPAATGEYAVPVIRALIERKPVFGICLGHQMLALAVGAKTMKMHQGHHGANHPVKNLTTGKVEITSMNHGFAVDGASLPDECRGNPCLSVRRLQLRYRAQRPAGVLGAVSSGGLARPER